MSPTPVSTRLLAERSRQRQPERDRAERRLTEVEKELANIMKAISAGIFTASTKADLEKKEAERDRLKQNHCGYNGKGVQSRDEAAEGKGAIS